MNLIIIDSFLKYDNNDKLKKNKQIIENLIDDKTIKEIEGILLSKRNF